MYPIERLLGRLKGFVANKAHPEGSIAEAYISKECTTFCSMYLDGVETLFNRPERNYDMGDRGLGLAVFTQTVRPFGLMTRASDVSVAERELAHWFVLHNSTEVDKHVEEHKNLLHQRAGAFDIENRHRKEFPKWFKDHMNELRSQHSPEATDDMWSLANGPSGLVNTYSGCICNGVRYHTIDRDNRRKSQNSGLLVEGEHEGQLIHFYGHLCRVWELNYLFTRRIVLFQCEWFNSGSSRTMRIEPHFTTVDVTSRWYKDDSFVLPSQVQQVFYVNDTKLGTSWRVVEKFEHRGIWDVPEMDVVQPDDAFQQEETTEVVPTMAIDDDVALRRDDIDSEIIPLEVLQSVRGVEAKGVTDDAFICDDEDGLMREGDDTDEEYDLQSDFDTDVDCSRTNWKMVPGLKTGRLRKKTLTQPETDSPAAIPLGSPVAPSPVVPVRSNVGPSHHVTSQPMDDSDETQAPSETQPSGVGTSKPLRVRGPTLGKGIQKIIRANKGEKCYVHIDRGLNAMTGKYATPATNELGIQIRTLCPLKDVKSWLDLDETTKAAVIQGVLDKFQIGDDFHNDLQAQEIVNKKAYGLYKDWRYTLKQEFELLEGLPRDEIYGHPPVGVSLDNWKHLIDVAWQDASHQKRSKAGKSNRSQLPYNHTNGSRSFPIAMAAMVAKDGELDFPKFYEDSHTSKKTNDWIHPKCRELHQEMVNVQAAAIESGTPLTQEEISRQVLGQKKRYLLGFGSGPQPSTIFATRAHDKDMEAMRAEVEALREERQKDHDELMKEREERERCYNELLKEREERIQLSNDMLKEREEGQKARDETNAKVEHLNNVVAKLSQLLGI
ncbi:unnamed protein product [Camellia sinensis]